jgi:hypothetical protein
VKRTGDDGCSTYRCECDSTDKAKCVINAPGGVSAVVVSPPLIKAVSAAASGAVLMSR